ncbi:uncharacterized protein B0T15DRAFT_518654 [Chaetomium strumarium]|uniref:Uncharacterized protein n=1 Tax=Chaetomium strumarium TaxID=1170767 RepID=A0AAJ0M642_9PEZI|nr:hypothetical protein B0T15DRAFT_518654 [Chaetomium strumarium]
MFWYPWYPIQEPYLLVEYLVRIAVMLILVFLPTIVRSAFRPVLAVFDYETGRWFIQALDQGRMSALSTIQRVLAFARQKGRKISICVIPVLALTLIAECHAAPIEINAASNPDLLSAIAAINATVSRASAQGVIQDSGILDDIERLLNIIGDHVERIRGPYVGNSTNNATTFTTTNTTASSTVPVAIGTGTKTTNNKAASTTITNPPSFADIFGSAHGSLSDKNITVNCKGISVCNPVTVVSDQNTTRTETSIGNGRGGRKGFRRRIG